MKHRNVVGVGGKRADFGERCAALSGVRFGLEDNVPRSVGLLVGENAADMLWEMIENKKHRIKGRYVPSKFIIRESLKIDNNVIKSLKNEFGEQIIVDF